MLSSIRGCFVTTGYPTAPGIFQKVMESLLKGIPNVIVYQDDILISGESEATHLQSLEEVLKRLSTAGLRVKKSKWCLQGLHPLPEKVEAITPRNVTELKSYLGLLWYYGKYLPNLSSCLAPLYRLLGKNTPWRWSTSQANAFQESKNLLSSAQLHVHFDPDLPLLLACDASAYGVGAV